jgi:hypothetical protein
VPWAVFSSSHLTCANAGRLLAYSEETIRAAPAIYVIPART